MSSAKPADPHPLQRGTGAPAGSEDASEGGAAEGGGGAGPSRPLGPAPLWAIPRGQRGKGPRPSDEFGWGPDRHPRTDLAQH